MKFKIPREWETIPPNISEIPEGIFIIQCDASWKRGISGISVQIKTKEMEYKPQEYSARSRGPVHAEMISVKKALQELRSIKRHKKMVIVYNDNRYVYLFLKRLLPARRTYIKNVLNDIFSLLKEINCIVDFKHTKSKYNRRVDRRALRKRKEVEALKNKQIEKRIARVERAIVRGREVKIVQQKDGTFRAMPKKGGFPPGYKVSLEPLSCECPYWQKKWANKDQYIIKARALPCKHICALAEYLRIDVYELFRKQIERVD